MIHHRTAFINQVRGLLGAGQVRVKHHDVRLSLLRQCHRFVRVGCRTDAAHCAAIRHWSARWSRGGYQRGHSWSTASAAATRPHWSSKLPELGDLRWRL